MPNAFTCHTNASHTISMRHVALKFLCCNTLLCTLRLHSNCNYNYYYNNNNNIYDFCHRKGALPGTLCCCTTFDHLLHLTASKHTLLEVYTYVCVSSIHTFYYWPHLSTIHAICILSCSKWHYVVVNYNQLLFAKRKKTLCWTYI